MLHSKFARRPTDFKAQKVFTDRIEPRQVFRRSIACCAETPQQIVVYYGKGGIGKSSLLKTLYANADDVYAQSPSCRFKSIFVSLDAYDFANPVNVLMAIRNGVDGDCGLFDYAMLQYCAKAKLNVEQIVQKNSVLSLPVMDVLNDLISLGTASACIPTATLRRCVALIKDHRLRAKYKEEIDRIETLNEFEIFERLPYYLGLCISHAASRGVIHVLFLDSYESLLARTEYGTFSVDREDWLRELFLSSEAIRVIIAARDRLRWDSEDPEWNEYLGQHLLTNLSDEDSRWFLEQVPIRDAAVADVIVKNAGGVPLYLDMCVSIYEDDMNEGKPFDLALAQNGERVIDRYIRHLSARDKTAIRILSAPKGFDLTFAGALLRRRNVLYEPDELRALLEKSIFLPIDEGRGLWKVDESVRLHQRANIGAQGMAEVLEAMLACVCADPQGAYYPHLALVLETVCAAPELLPALCEKCVQAVEYYANAGFWNELHGLLAPYADGENARLRALAALEEAIYLRRTGRLAEALSLMDGHPCGKDELGVWYYMYRYLRIQLRHLLGYYDESLAAYRALVEEMELIRPLIPDHIYFAPCMKYADLLFLKGDFDGSLRLVEKLLAENRADAADQIELLRIKGHIFRFRQQTEKAELIYASALELAQTRGIRADVGKLYTNMTEALCTARPAEALAWYEKARTTNYDASNGVELGKAYAAASAANTALGRLDEAVLLAKQAVSTAEMTGYLSGKAFGLAALYYACSSAGREAEALRARTDLEGLIGQLGVYRYILEWVGV